MRFFYIDQISFNKITSQQIETINRWIMILFSTFIFSACTEESRNQMFKQADNLLGKDLRVSYVADNGNIVKSWTVRDGKLPAKKILPEMLSATIIFGATKQDMFKFL